MDVKNLIRELFAYSNDVIHPSSHFISIKGTDPKFISSNIDLVSGFLSNKDKVIISQLENRDYYRFSAFESLIKKLVSVNSNQSEKLLKKYKRYLSKICPQLYGKTKPNRFNIADSIVFAVVRRISRESHHSALLIDGASRFFLELLGEILIKYNSINIFLPDFDFWDRPSLRIINRVNKLNQTIGIKWVVFTRYGRGFNEAKTDEFTRKIMYSHSSFLEKFKQIQPNSKEFQINDSGTIEIPQPVLDKIDINMNEMAIDLAFQNYERVYYIAKLALSKTHQSEEKSQILRLVALTDASRGDYKDADKQLEEALQLTKQNSFKAHLKYLQGLIYTKRFYDLENANRHYDEGLELLKVGNGMNNSVYAMEKAWLFNGKALVCALKAKSLIKEEKEQEILKSFNLEIEAYNLIKKGNSPNLSYLRFNLLANITFLLEIDKKYNEAINFWIKAFERYLTKNNPAFELAFKTRLGLLQYKAGKNTKAIESLKDAYQTCFQLKDPFYEQRIAYAYAYVLFNCNKYKESIDFFVKGMEVSGKIKEWGDFAEHLKGVLLAAVALQNKKLVKMIYKVAISNKNINSHQYETFIDTISLSRNMKELPIADIKLKDPEPKLSSYIPSVDLEGTPEKDLNRYLVSSITTGFKKH